MSDPIRKLVYRLEVNQSVAQRNAENLRKKREAERLEREQMAWLADGPAMNEEGDK